MMWLKKHSQTLILTAILAVAALLRLYAIGPYQTFLGDEGRDVLIAYGILHGKFTLLGPTASVGGFFFGPIYYYMIAPFLWLFHYDPVGPAVMVALIALLTIYLVYLLGKYFFSSAVGLLAAFFYATSALLVTYSRSSWNPHVVPFFVLLTTLALFKFVATARRKWLILSGFCYGITFELHYVTLFFAAAVVMFLAIYLHEKKAALWVRRLGVGYVLWGVGFLGGISPILAFELRHQFVNTRNIVTFMFHSKDAGSGGQFFPTVADVFSRVFARYLFGYPMPDQLVHYSASTLTAWYWMGIIGGCAATGLLFYLTIDAYKKSREKFLQYLFLCLWLTFGIVLFGFYKKNIYEYYFEFLTPLVCVLVASLGMYLWRIGGRAKILVPLTIIGVFFLNTTQWPFHYPPNNQVQQTATIARAVLNETNGQPFNFALITGGNSDYAYRYFFTLWGHPPITIDNSVVDPVRHSVTSQLLVVCESLPCYPLGNPLWEIAGFGRANIVNIKKVSVVEVYKLDHYTGSQ